MLFSFMYCIYSFSILTVSDLTCAVPEIPHWFTDIVKINLILMIILTESISEICQETKKDNNRHRRNPHPRYILIKLLALLLHCSSC